MNKTIYITKEQLPKAVKRSFVGYPGNKFKIQICEQVELQGTYWSGGSRSDYRQLSLEGHGEHMYPSDSPFEKKGVEGSTVFLQPGNVVVEHSIFCGKDMGLTIFMLQEDFDKLGIKVVDEIDPRIKEVLYPFVSIKSGDYRKEALKQRNVKQADIDKLIEMGYLKKNKAGAITATLEAKNVVRG